MLIIRLFACLVIVLSSALSQCYIYFNYVDCSRCPNPSLYACTENNSIQGYRRVSTTLRHQAREFTDYSLLTPGVC